MLYLFFDGTMYFFTIFITVLFISYKIRDKKDLNKLEARFDDLDKEFEKIETQYNALLERIKTLIQGLNDTSTELPKEIEEHLNKMNEDKIDLYREKNKQTDAAELFQKKENMKTALEMMYYNMYVNEKKKNLDFPEEKKRVCEILPLINLSIADKIDIGRILLYRNFNAAFPTTVHNNTLNIITQEPYTKDDQIYIRFTRSAFVGGSLTYAKTTCTYNILLNTYVVEKDLAIDEFFSSTYDYSDLDLEKKRTDARNKIIHALEQPTAV